MNKYGKLNRVLKIISSVFCSTIFTYVAWVLCTPGYYCYLLLFGILTLGYLCLKKKLNDWINNKFKNYTYVDLIEHKFASTYRKRFYHNEYLVLLLLTIIISTTYLIGVIKNQTDNKLNTEYINAIEYTFGTILEYKEYDVTIYKKLTPIIPNSLKAAFVDTSYTMHLVLELAEIVKNADQTGGIEKDTILYYENKIEDLQSNLKSKEEGLHLHIIAAGISFVLIKYSLKELRKYTLHRSIELKA